MPLVDIGRKAPAFTLKDSEGQKHSLKDYAGKFVVLYFYPKDDTSGCTKQACQFRDSLPGFDSSDAVILGVSPDDEVSHRKFIAKHDLNFTLLADPKDKDSNPGVCAKYGVWQEKSMYGRTYMGVVRTTYLIGPDGKVLQRWDKVKVPGHDQAVLDCIRETAT
ncbi:MAG: thioredoxin-dependent thiol peroxidase [Planctomycetota bacterium]|nr:thioredoxin-dependent thiol peroxidase [Planctomycetota bacterium]MEC8734879.1 thioredoxin-dependent thiol peroxidase [Planctomycetota bacterium]MEC9157103.1 thioredoxin-dependent thiol peroxidase [Planctomycetota bacterium]